MIDVIQNERGSGKTYTIMQEIKEAIVAGTAPSEIAVVLLGSHRIHDWTRQWQYLMGTTVRPPEIMTHTTAGIRLRGAHLKRLYVEDIDGYRDGIYDPRIMDIIHCTKDVVFTSSCL